MKKKRNNIFDTIDKVLPLISALGDTVNKIVASPKELDGTPEQRVDRVRNEIQAAIAHSFGDITLDEVIGKFEDAKNALSLTKNNPKKSNEYKKGVIEKLELLKGIRNRLNVLTLPTVIPVEINSIAGIGKAVGQVEQAKTLIKLYKVLIGLQRTYVETYGQGCGAFADTKRKAQLEAHIQRLTTDIETAEAALGEEGRSVFQAEKKQIHVTSVSASQRAPEPSKPTSSEKLSVIQEEDEMQDEPEQKMLFMPLEVGEVNGKTASFLKAYVREDPSPHIDPTSIQRISTKDSKLPDGYIENITIKNNALANMHKHLAEQFGVYLLAYAKSKDPSNDTDLKLLSEACRDLYDEIEEVEEQLIGDERLMFQLSYVGSNIIQQFYLDAIQKVGVSDYLNGQWAIAKIHYANYKALEAKGEPTNKQEESLRKEANQLIKIEGGFTLGAKLFLQLEYLEAVKNDFLDFGKNPNQQGKVRVGIPAETTPEPTPPPAPVEKVFRIEGMLDEVNITGRLITGPSSHVIAGSITAIFPTERAKKYETLFSTIRSKHDQILSKHTELAKKLGDCIKAVNTPGKQQTTDQQNVIKECQTLFNEIVEAGRKLSDGELGLFQLYHMSTDHIQGLYRAEIAKIQNDPSINKFITSSEAQAKIVYECWRETLKKHNPDVNGGSNRVQSGTPENFQSYSIIAHILASLIYMDNKKQDFLDMFQHAEVAQESQIQPQATAANAVPRPLARLDSEVSSSIDSVTWQNQIEKKKPGNGHRKTIRELCEKRLRYTQPPEKGTYNLVAGVLRTESEDVAQPKKEESAKQQKDRRLNEFLKNVIEARNLARQQATEYLQQHQRNGKMGIPRPL